MSELGKDLVFAGVDARKDAHTLCLLDHMGRAIGTFRFAADAKGCDALAGKIGGPATCAGVGVEGTGSYGAGLTRRLLKLGYRVYEAMVPGRARRKPGRPKSDPADAEAAARQVLAGVDPSKPKDQSGRTEELRRLMIARDRLVQAASAMINAAKSLTVAAPEDLRRSLEGLSRKNLRSALSTLDPAAGGIVLALGSLGKAWDLQDREADAIEERMKQVLEANAPALLAIYGCGAVSAAALAVAGGGNPERLRRSEAEFASLCGVAPLLASSGKTERHRLNRGGDRRANRALYQIAVTRMSYDQRTKDYVGKRKRDGKSKKEAIRCLKRYIAREAFRALRNPLEIKGPSWKDLRPARQALGITLVEAGKAPNVGFQRVSYAETGRLMNVRFLEEYDAWLKSQAKRES